MLRFTIRMFKPFMTYYRYKKGLQAWQYNRKERKFLTSQANWMEEHLTEKDFSPEVLSNHRHLPIPEVGACSVIGWLPYNTEFTEFELLETNELKWYPFPSCANTYTQRLFPSTFLEYKEEGTEFLWNFVFSPRWDIDYEDFSPESDTIIEGRSWDDELTVTSKGLPRKEGSLKRVISRMRIAAKGEIPVDWYYTYEEGLLL